jgi:putative resolvase
MRDYITPPEAAKLLDVTKATLYRWIEAGQMKAHRIGGRWRIPPQEVERILGREITPVTEEKEKEKDQ